MSTNTFTPLLLGAILAACFSHGAATASPGSVVLTGNGGTDYVLTGDPAQADIALALEELGEHLTDVPALGEGSLAVFC